MCADEKLLGLEVVFVGAGSVGGPAVAVDDRVQVAVAVDEGVLAEVGVRIRNNDSSNPSIADNTRAVAEGREKPKPGVVSGFSLQTLFASFPHVAGLFRFRFRHVSMAHSLSEPVTFCRGPSRHRYRTSSHLLSPPCAPEIFRVDPFDGSR